MSFAGNNMIRRTSSAALPDGTSGADLKYWWAGYNSGDVAANGIWYDHISSTAMQLYSGAFVDAIRNGVPAGLLILKETGDPSGDPNTAGAYGKVASLEITGDHTIMGWARLGDVSGGSSYPVFFDGRALDGSDRVLLHPAHASFSGAPYVATRFDGTTYGVMNGSSNVYTRYIWRHWCVIAQAGQPLKLFSDGVLLLADDANMPDPIGTYTFPWWVGIQYDLNVGTKLNAAVDDHRIYQRAIDPVTELAAIVAWNRGATA